MASGESAVDALLGGYHLAFLIGAIFAASAAVVGAVFLRPQQQPAMHGEPAAEGA